jgi:hypothetical protein
MDYYALQNLCGMLGGEGLAAGAAWSAGREARNSRSGIRRRGGALTDLAASISPFCGYFLL